jgi:hypothetical protein
MPRLEQAAHTGTPYYNIMNHCKDISTKWKQMDEFLRFTGRLDPDLKEEVRRALAQQSGCKFCAQLRRCARRRCRALRHCGCEQPEGHLGRGVRRGARTLQRGGDR